MFLVSLVVRMFNSQNFLLFYFISSTNKTLILLGPLTRLKGDHIVCNFQSTHHLHDLCHSIIFISCFVLV
jgi:hypothetical protein